MKLRLLGVLAALWLFGLVRFVGARPVIEVQVPPTAPRPDREHNLASFRYGPTVRVSSYDREVITPHHPSFLVDERVGPRPAEKWVSAVGDRQPWVEITWGAPRTLERVVIHHAGAYEDPQLTLDRYAITCLAKYPRTSRVAGNDVPLAIHQFDCADAYGIRIDAQPTHGGVVRLYEIEAWGR